MLPATHHVCNACQWPVPHSERCAQQPLSCSSVGAGASATWLLGCGAPCGNEVGETSRTVLVVVAPWQCGRWGGVRWRRGVAYRLKDARGDFTAFAFRAY